MGWTLQPYGRSGGISGEGVKNLLEASGFSTREDLIVREAIQNSVDALDKKKGHKVRVVIRKISLVGKQKKRFIELLKLKELGENSGLVKTTPDDSPLRKLDSSEPLGLLYIEDFNTVGLGGGLEDLQGNYYRLLFLVGDGMKADEDAELGGSYGYGKSVYASNASTSTIVTFSVFQPTAKTEHHFARLLGSTFQKAFSRGKKDFTGRGWLGGEVGEDDVPDPLVDNKALKFASELGFSKRDKNSHGTSMLLVGTKISGNDFSIDRMREAIETWWWPRYVSDGLDIELWDNNKITPPPRPAQRQDLKPYVECFRQMNNGSTDNIKVTTYNKFAKTGLEMGSIALRAMTEDGLPSKEMATLGPSNRRVALLRSPLMVVEYHPCGSERREPFIGVYQGTPDIDNFLRLSEPKEHHRWDPLARRLQAREYGTSVVQSVIARCHATVKDFQASLAPKKEKPKDRLDVLDKLLGAAFQVDDGRPQPPPPGYGKAHIDFPSGPAAVKYKDGIRLETVVRVRLKEDQESPQQVSIKPKIVIVENAERTGGDHLNLEVYSDAGKKIADGESPDFNLKIKSDEFTTLKIVSERYSEDWVADFAIAVE